MKWLCWHNWRIKKHEILPSLLEQFEKAGVAKLEGGRESIGHKPCIVIYCCSKCSTEKVKRV